MNALTHHAQSLSAMHASFLAIAPRIERHGRVYFRGLKDADKREEAIQEMIALSWKWSVRLAERGKDVTQFPSAIAGYAARAVRSGRRLCGQEKTQDALSPLAQRRRGFAVGPLPEESRLGNVFDEALHDNTQTPPDEQAAFRMDFPRWLSGQGERNGRIAFDLMLGERTSAVARRYALSPSRVSQMRTQFRDGWRRFQDGPEEIRDGRRTAVA
jgi:hypothetical protein